MLIHMTINILYTLKKEKISNLKYNKFQKIKFLFHTQRWKKRKNFQNYLKKKKKTYLKFVIFLSMHSIICITYWFGYFYLFIYFSFPTNRYVFNSSINRERISVVRGNSSAGNLTGFRGSPQSGCPWGKTTHPVPNQLVALPCATSFLSSPLPLFLRPYWG